MIKSSLHTLDDIHLMVNTINGEKFSIKTIKNRETVEFKRGFGQIWQAKNAIDFTAWSERDIFAISTKVREWGVIILGNVFLDPQEQNKSWKWHQSTQNHKETLPWHTHANEPYDFTTLAQRKEDKPRTVSTFSCPTTSLENFMTMEAQERLKNTYPSPNLKRIYTYLSLPASQTGEKALRFNHDYLTASSREKTHLNNFLEAINHRGVDIIIEKTWDEQKFAEPPKLIMMIHTGEIAPGIPKMFHGRVIEPKIIVKGDPLWISNY